MSFLKKIRDHLWYKRVAYFFPVQLFILHFKRNHLLIFFWFLLFGFVTQNIAARYGIPFLFLEPEYMGQVGIRSHFILGVCLGIFIMAFNISSYIINGTSFPFIVTLYRPLLKYCINNFFIPLIFSIVFIYEIFQFQLLPNCSNFLDVLLNVCVLLTGITLFIVLSFTYFFSRTKNIFKLFGIKGDEEGSPIFPINIDKLDKKKRLKTRRWRIETYLSGKFSVRLIRSGNHYTPHMIETVFKQNHSNAAFFQISLVIILLVMGLFRDIPLFIIPAGGSLFLISALFLMITSAIHYWLRGWSTSILILLFLISNYLPEKGYFNTISKAYGLNYTTHAKYPSNNKKINQNEVNNDLNEGNQILVNWKKKTGQLKPKLIIINPSGGGLRSAVWTFLALQHGDSITKGKLLNQSQLISGSSGGMLGAAYIRELHLQKQNNKIESIYKSEYIDNIAKDLLNPIAYSLAVNDLFISYRDYMINDEIHQKDRGYAFEKQLNRNTNNILDKRVFDYKVDEQKANIPLMLISTTNINDGKRIIISPQKLAYLSNKEPDKNSKNHYLFDEIEFSKLFKEQGAEQLLFTSALRMNATFPYIFPAVTLPCVPEAVVMDAGGRDNFGLQLSLKYLYAHRDWIASNTSGVIILQTRGKDKNAPYLQKQKTLINRFVRPLGSMYENLSNIHNYNHDQLIQYASTWFNGPIDVITLSIKDSEKNQVSLSWHLTEQEKSAVISSLNTDDNKLEYKRLQKLLK